MKAWEVHLRGFDTTIAFAKSRSAARYRVLAAARDSGYRIEFTEKMRVVRAPEYDQHTETLGGRLYTRKIAERLIAK